MSRTDDMVTGYIAGLRSGAPDLPECYATCSPAFKHGWRNGRDDRIGTPREVARVLRNRADMILGDEA